jgi:hypothetical protein
MLADCDSAFMEWVDIAMEFISKPVFSKFTAIRIVAA